MTSLLMAATEWVPTAPTETALVLKAVVARGPVYDTALKKQIETTPKHFAGSRSQRLTLIFKETPQ